MAARLRAVAVCAASLAGLVAVAGWPSVPPVGAIDKLVYLAAAATLLVPAIAALAGRGAELADVALAGLPTLWLAWPLLETGSLANWLIAFAVALAGWGLLRSARRPTMQIIGPPTLFVTVLSLAVVGFLGASIHLAEISGALAAGLAAAVAIGYLGRRTLGANGPVSYAATLLLFLQASILAFYTVSAPLALVLLVTAVLLAGRFAQSRPSRGPAADRESPGELAQAGSASLLASVPALAAIAVAAAVSPGVPVY